MNFSRYYFLCIEFWEYSLRLLGVRIFFHKIFSCTNIFLNVLRPHLPAPSNNVSNGPSHLYLYNFVFLFLLHPIDNTLVVQYQLVQG